MSSLFKRSINRLDQQVILVLLIIGLIWFIALNLSHQAPDWDNMEELVWASSFELGYQKHPPFPSWLLYPATLLFGKSVWLPLAMGLLCVFVANLFIYFLLKDIAGQSKTPLCAYAPLIAVLVSSPLAYYTIRGGDYNHNSVQLWSLAGLMFFYYRAWLVERHENFSRAKWGIYWTLVGVFTGIALITKYSALIQIGVLGLHFLWARRWDNKHALLGALIAIFWGMLVLTPHAYWFYLQYIQGLGPLNYAKSLMHAYEGFAYELKHLLVDFLFTQIYRIIPVLLVLWMAIRCTKNKATLVKTSEGLDPRNQGTISWWGRLQRQDQVFLVFLILGPTLFSMFLGIFLQWRIEAKWAVTFYLLIGAVSWIFIKKDISWQQFLKWVLAFHLVYALGYTLALGPIATAKSQTSRANYPSQAISKLMQQRWMEHPEITQAQSLKLIAGSTWTAGNVMLFGPDRGRAIRVWIDADLLSSPWLTEADLDQPVLVVINRSVHRGDAPSKKVEDLYQKAPLKGHESIPWLDKQKIEMDWAILPSGKMSE